MSERVDTQREAITMALYTSITLLAGLIVMAPNRRTHIDVLEVVWGTTVGLALAHWVAFGLAARLVDDVRGRRVIDRDLAAVLLGAGAMAVLATVAVLLAPSNIEWAAARYTVAAAIGLIAFVLIRAQGGSTSRAFAVAAVGLALAEAVAFIKATISH